jgi:hypothetical protein
LFICVPQLFNHYKLIREISLSIGILFLCLGLDAQERSGNIPVGIKQSISYEVSGVVQDSTGQSMSAVTILLTSARDTLKTLTDSDGIYVFNQVKSSTFILTVAFPEYKTLVIKSLNPPGKVNIILDPIILSSQATMLNEVKITGTPAIIYKTDTVEYRAAEYTVRENSNVEELLKAMEGMEVSGDGKLQHNGQKVKKARLNGKDFAGGDVARAIKSLPAEIVEKIQIVDDYGDQASRTGIKDGNFTKVLNITTKADKSVGIMGSVTLSGGNDKRYKENLFIQRINGNKQLGFAGTISNTVNGVANEDPDKEISNVGDQRPGVPSGNSNAGSGGTASAKAFLFNYADQWSKALQVNMFYNYSGNNINLINDNVFQQFSTLGNTAGSSHTAVTDRQDLHNLTLELEFTPDKQNFLKITPLLGINHMGKNSLSQRNESGLINQDFSGNTLFKNNIPSYGLRLFYQHIFKNPRRIFSSASEMFVVNQEQNSLQDSRILYRNSLQELVSDSAVNRQILKNNDNIKFQTGLTFTEPVGNAQLEFTTEINYTKDDNSILTNNINSSVSSTIIDSLSNQYRYSFFTHQFGVNYRIIRSNYNLTLGLRLLSTYLEGGSYSTVERTNQRNLYFFPVLRFQYAISPTEQFAVNYSGSIVRPNSIQLQPVPDFSDPTNPVYGNSFLKPTFVNTVNALYNNYIPNSKLNLSGNIRVTLLKDQVVNNNILVLQPLINAYLNETRFTNLSGSSNLYANYNIAKQLNNRKYNLQLNGSVQFGHFKTFNNNILNTNTILLISQRFGPRINPNRVIEVNPYISYKLYKSSNTIPGADINTIKTTVLSVDGSFLLMDTWRLSYSANKNFIKGIDASLSGNPFVVNAAIENEILKKRNLRLKLQVFDLFNQNKFINRVITENRVTDNRTNGLSRYFLLSAVFNLNKWSGEAKNKGKILKRRNDGSFIN